MSNIYMKYSVRDDILTCLRCLKLKYEAVELFNQMRKFEYYCAVPNEVAASHFECRKII